MKREFSVRILATAYATIKADTLEEAAEIAQYIDLTKCTFDDYIRPSDISICDEDDPA